MSSWLFVFLLSHVSCSVSGHLGLSFVHLCVMCVAKHCHVAVLYCVLEEFLSQWNLLATMFKFPAWLRKAWHFQFLYIVIVFFYTIRFAVTFLTCFGFGLGTHFECCCIMTFIFFSNITGVIWVIRVQKKIQMHLIHLLRYCVAF